ncbi:MAG: hypothetical protein U1E52_07030 [Geminicoccaceae bacterium]
MLLDGGNRAEQGGSGFQGIGGVPARARPRRRQMALQEVATPIAATFLGLLLAQDLHQAIAAVGAHGQGAAAADQDGPGLHDIATHDAAPSALAVDGGIPGTAGQAPSGDLDLAGLAGSLGVAGPELEEHAAGPATGPGGLGELHAPEGAAATAAGVTFASAPPAAVAEAEAPSPADAEDVGPIGRYVQGDGSDGTTVLTSGDDIFIGSDGNEHVVGGAGDDYIDGAGGDDHLEGGSGDDTLLGGSGDDLLEGGMGDDLLDGGTGDDVLLGGGGDDVLLGGGGDDFLNGGAGIDRLAGGTGNEILVLADVRDALTELGLGADGGGNDTVVVVDSYSKSLAAALSGSDGRATFVLGRPDVANFPTDVAGFRQQIDPDIENIRLEGSARHDVVGDDHGSLIVGNDGANHIYAGGGDDAVYGGGGNDFIDAGAGNDWLDGGLGDDTLYGGAGDDVYVLGLQESGDLVFDHEGNNSLRLIGADPARLTLDLQGGDLIIAHAGKVVATVSDYASHPESIAGIDLGQGLRPLSDFTADHGAMAAQSVAPADWLADYAPAPGLAEPLPEPWAGLDHGEAEPVAAPSAPVQTVAAVAAQSVSSLSALTGDHAAADLWQPMDDSAPLGDHQALTGEDGQHHGRAATG